MNYSYEFLMTVLENIDIGIFVLDAKGNYLYVNNEYCELLNRARDTYEGMSIPKFKEQGYLTSSVWDMVIEKKAPITTIVTINDFLFNKVYHFFTTATPTFNSDGSIKYIFFTQEPIEKTSKRIQTGILNRHVITGSIVNPRAPQFDIIAESPQMKQVLEMLYHVSKTDASILISGPSGVGKEVLTKYIHHTSLRNKGPFIVLNCAAIPENLMESELYGYEKGAFSGASSYGKEGLIEAANGGTLFLDEINSMPLGLQAKLLRVLETKQVTRLGSVVPKEIDFRLVCATNENLPDLVSKKLFRSDLFYRINVISVYIPPLCERKEDIIPLSLFYIQYFCKKYNCVKALDENVLNTMLSYKWHGNVRELRNFIERLIISSPDTELIISTIPQEPLLQDEDKTTNSTNSSTNLSSVIDMDTISHYDEIFSLSSYMDECEKKLLLDLLEQYKSPLKVAQVLKIDLSNVYRKIKKYNLKSIKDRG
ncbi:transcriptional regulator with PAS, ATPase and Fis domain [Sedimentibacter acidaminivorans]|uniref:HTH-type transcriptional regulatory protein TyrR n=1 Tax=Sedimentibacter acidaminivorans TaxID=913099 RepID=A0ABS4GBU9_9FIRM|nr:sigma 54-interacting transcriptional regulator [Sedimentibacter acidaminivorans]MBP1925142.1 transcriptional regulator with PAS, ATPase and Fis domain [Sedimentibacter acidaminivorans]